MKIFDIIATENPQHALNSALNADLSKPRPHVQKKQSLNSLFSYNILRGSYSHIAWIYAKKSKTLELQLQYGHILHMGGNAARYIADI